MINNGVLYIAIAIASASRHKLAVVCNLLPASYLGSNYITAIHNKSYSIYYSFYYYLGSFLVCSLGMSMLSYIAIATV